MPKKILCTEIVPQIPNLGRYIIMPRYGLLTIASIISRKSNHRIEMLFEPYIGTLDLSRIIEYEADYILLNGLTTSGPQNRFLIERLRQESKKAFLVISGGEHANIFPHMVMNYSDYVIQYEGDEAIIELLNALEIEDVVTREMKLRNISGLFFRDSKGNLCKSDFTKRVECIDYKYDFNVLINSKNVRRKLALAMMPLQISRGCKHLCSFCTWVALYGKSGYISRPIQDIIYDIDHTINYTGIQSFMVVDNMFGGDTIYTKELLKQIVDTFKRKPVKPIFVVLCRADQFVGSNNVFSDDFLQLMRDAGIKQISLGLESINEDSLKKMGKKSNTQTYIDAASRLNKYGFKMAATFVTGYGSDTYDDVMNISKFARKIGCYTIQIYSQNITPRTPDANRNPYMAIPCAPIEYMNGHNTMVFTHNMLPSITQKAIFDSAMEFYTDDGQGRTKFKKVMRFFYSQIWKGMKPFYNALSEIEQKILIPEGLYVKNAVGDYRLHEEKLMAVYQNKTDYKLFASGIRDIFKLHCKPIAGEYNNTPIYYLENY